MTNKLPIFIVDEDPFWSHLLNEMLYKLGFLNVTNFFTGRECINHLRLTPRVIFLDYHLDDANGIQILQEIKKHDPLMCVVFCTASEDLCIAIDAMKFGSADYLLKEDATIDQLNDILHGLKWKMAFTDKVF